ncbi:MAG: Trk system potassium transporter TrkA [Ruminococcus bromii]|nr:Trk system potassium transporter TrkA [Ruminococcus bromii]MCI7210833.1 Trk system potassium transporter TrkA [Ruminococcus bromii]MDD6434069.1 Trk system potassium transporter TrkA [Ruminococcus bromii]MDY4085032.1 Trk system potassium transporter TrkA [Ruminococcus bromii]MDY4711444.1 Trk system potassium transporter TrkA [Ruminococcus bromii]
MNIVIVGCGKVGTSIAHELNTEGHDIVLVDINGDAVSRLSDSIDAMGVEGNGATYDTLTEAGVQNADLVVAVTAKDEVNLYACLMAKSAGVKHTIARVRNPEYTQDLFRVKDLLGLSMAINPEQTTAIEISQLFRFAGASEVDTLSRGMVELIKVTVPEKSIVANKRISQIDILKNKVRICSVERGSEVYIPNGDFVIQSGDKISIVSKSETAAKFFRKVNVIIGRSRDVILLGGGKISFYLAQRLIKSGTNVKIIEKNPIRCKELAELLPEAVIINGDCMDQDLLLSEGIDHADGVAALMDFDEENILISLYIKGVSKAKIITKVNNTSFDNIVEQLNLECVINPKNISGEYIASYIRAMQNSLGSNVETLYRLNEDRVEALEFNAKNSSKLVGIPISKLNLKDNLQIICINRKGRIILPVGSDSIMTDDLVIVITKHKGLSDLDDILD